MEPTCTEEGYTLHQCACGDSYKTESVAALGHNFEFTKTEKPTCTANGYTLETCTKCGETQKTNIIAALGHNWSKDMTTGTRTCLRCKQVEKVIVIPPQPTESQSVMDEGEAPDETIPPETDADVPDETLPPEEENSVSTQAADRILESETTTSYSYIYASGKLLQEKVTTSGATETHNFFYDNTGKPYAMQINGTTYYYVTNLQGDVMGLVDTSGNSVASYTYDPYGKVLTATGELADKNPLRYRGYYYDSESGLYYLQSRYYDPVTRRFINADSYAGTGQGLIGHNMFSYCLNNPINCSDDSGNWSMPNWLKVTVGVAAIAGLAVATVCTGGAAAVICGAALSGAIAGGASGAVIGAVGGGISGGWQGALDGACSGFMSGTLVGGVTGAASAGLNIATGATTIVGNAHGSTLHKLASNMEAGKMAASGQYSQIGLNKSLGKMGLNGGLTRPDVTGVANDGAHMLVEVVSPRQSIDYVVNKMSNMLSQNPGAVGKIVKWVRRLFE